MSKPNLIIVAGCNGSGKSTFSKSYNPAIEPFDYDKRFLETYRLLPDSEFRETIARNRTTEEFEKAIQEAFSKKIDFCYETNFHQYPIDYARKALQLGYKLTLHFYCLDNIDIAIERVAVRTANRGHFVRNDVINYKWKEGYKNLNLYFKFFDYILLIDNSVHLSIPNNLFGLIKNDKGGFDVEMYSDEIPSYSKRRFPEILNIIID